MLSQFEGRPVTEDDIAREGQGRPFFPGRDADFSISHSGTLAAVSLVRGNLRTSCDVELVRPRLRKREIAEEYFSASEIDYIFSMSCKVPHCDEDARFNQIWTLKECYLKLRGQTVFDMAGVPSFIADGDFAFGAAVSVPLEFSIYGMRENSGARYILSTAVEGAQEVQPEICRFTQETPSCISIAKIKAPLSPAQTVRPKM